MFTRRRHQETRRPLINPVSTARLAARPQTLATSPPNTIASLVLITEWSIVAATIRCTGFVSLPSPSHHPDRSDFVSFPVFVTLVLCLPPPLPDTVRSFVTAKSISISLLLGSSSSTAMPRTIPHAGWLVWIFGRLFLGVAGNEWRMELELESIRSRNLLAVG